MKKHNFLTDLIIMLEKGTNGEDPTFNLGYIQAIIDVRKILEKYDF